MIDTYNKVVKLILKDDLSTDSKIKLIKMLVAQIPRADELSKKIFAQESADHIAKTGRQVYLLGMINPWTGKPCQATARREVYPSEDEVVTIQACWHSHAENTLCLTRYAANLICKFHRVQPPSLDELRQVDSESISIVIEYEHVSGHAVVLFTENADPLLIFSGNFSPDSFVPVRIEIIEGTN